jgi:hypothetical protein
MYTHTQRQRETGEEEKKARRVRTHTSIYPVREGRRKKEEEKEEEEDC